MTTTVLEHPNTTTLMESYKYADLADLLQGLIDVQDLKGVKFALQISKNTRLIKAELLELEEAARPDEDFIALATKVQSVEASELTPEEKQEAVAKIEEENAELVQKRKDQIREFQAMMADTTELSLFKISEKHLPGDITAKQLNDISLIIKE